jgi:hypothetical protein
MQNVYEQFFFLKYAGGWSFTEAYNLPIGLRDWFTKRLVKQIESENEAIEKASNSSGNSRTQQLNANNQPQMPSNLSKFVG